MPSVIESVVGDIIFHPLFPYPNAFIRALHPPECFSSFFNIWLSACVALTANLRRHATATGDERWIAALGKAENLLATAERHRDLNATLYQRMRAGYALATLHSTLRFYSRDAGI